MNTTSELTTSKMPPKVWLAYWINNAWPALADDEAVMHCYWELTRLQSEATRGRMSDAALRRARCPVTAAFVYRAAGPLPWDVVRSNRIELAPSGASYTRYYISADGAESAGISHTFPPDTSPEQIAEAINWGCTGVSRGAWQLSGLLESVRAALRKAGVK